jgi:hypothetical protein
MKTQLSQGQEMTGIFTADFYDSKIDLSQVEITINKSEFSAKANTKDGGKT